MKKTCKTCEFYPNDCGYVALNGTKDKGGNVINIDFDNVHNCPDHRLDTTKLKIKGMSNV